MEHLLLIIIGILLLIIFALLAKVYFLRKSAQEIAEAFRDRSTADTNTLIDISTRDRCMRKLAADINAQLRLLRGQRHRYLTGDRELKEAVTGISHDLRTPLTAICGYMQLLEGMEHDGDTARCLSLIQNRVDAMKGLTEELFRYSLILSAGEPSVESVCLNSALEESIAAFYPALTGRGIQPEIHITGDRLERRLDREALGRVYGNILHNAVKYSDGQLKIALRPDGTAVFSNTASALTQVQVGKLFDRFFTVEAARDSSGLGLSIARALVEQMGGGISARYDQGVLSIEVSFPESPGRGLT